METIRDFALWPPFLAAREILSVVYAGHSLQDGRSLETGDGPSELLPVARSYATERVFYRSIVIDHIESPEGSISADLEDLGSGRRKFDLMMLEDESTGFDSVALGGVVTFSQTWYPQGVSLGSLLHSVALAPGEMTRTAVIDWSRRQGIRAEEQIEQTEALRRTTHQTRGIDETTRGHVVEDQSGESETESFGSSRDRGGALGASGGGLSLGGSTSASDTSSFSRVVTSSHGERTITAEFAQDIRHHTQEAASAARARRAAIVQEVEQAESERVQTRVVVNYNHSHALSIQYYEVVQIFRTVVRLAKAERGIFIPMALLDFRDPRVIRRYRSRLLEVTLSDRHRDLLLSAGGRVRVDREGEHVSARNHERAREAAWQRHIDEDLGGVFSGDPGERDRWLNDHPEAVRREVQAFENDQRQEAAEEERRNAEWQVEGNALDGVYSIPEEFRLVWINVIGHGLEVEQIQIRSKGSADREEIPFNPRGNDLYEGILVGPHRLSEIDTIAAAIEPRANDSDPTDVWVTLRFTTRSDAEELAADADTSTPYSGLNPPEGVFELVIPLVVRPGRSRLQMISTGMTGEDEEAGRALNEDRLFYSQRIWEQIDPQTLTLITSRYSYRGKRLSEYADPIPLATHGNYLVLRWHDESDPQWQEWREDNIDPNDVEEDLVPLPTGGVFAEAVLGRYNASEKLDLTRFWNWQDSPIPHQAPEIQPVATGSRATPADVRPGSLDPAAVSLAGVPQLPGSDGVAAILGVLAASNIFRDMSGAGIAGALGQTAMSTAAAGSQAAAAQAGKNMEVAAQLEATRIRAATDLISTYLGGKPAGGGGSWNSVNPTTAGAAIQHGRTMDRERDEAGGGGSGAGRGSETGSAGGARSNEESAYRSWIGDTQSSDRQGSVLDDPTASAQAGQFELDEHGNLQPVATDAVPPNYCATYTPTRSDRLVVAGQEFEVPNLSVVNWLSGDVHQFSPGTITCRHFADVDELVIHETDTDQWTLAAQQRFGGRGLATHLAIQDDGTVYQHLDLVQLGVHAAPHNTRSIGIDIVQHHVPVGAVDSSQNTDEYLGSTNWAHDDGSNADHSYALPSEDQVEALHTLTEWLTSNAATHGLPLPADFAGISDDHFVFFYFTDFQAGRNPVPGIYAHGHIGGRVAANAHVDGFFHALYLWLRMRSNGGQGLAHQAAWDRAKELATSATFGDVTGVLDGRPVVDLSADL